MKDPLFFKRIVMCLVGMILCGLAVALLNVSVFGADPFQVFAQGLHNVFRGIPVFAAYGTFYATLSAVLLAIDFFLLDRHYIGLATFINLFLLGYLITFIQQCITYFLPDPNLLARIVLLVLGLLTSCVAAALYYTADLGVSVYDTIPLTLTDRKFQVAGRAIPFRFWRIGCDLICVTVGFFCGATIGIGTVLTAFFMGPLIELFKRRLAEPLLYGQSRSAA